MTIDVNLPGQSFGDAIGTIDIDFVTDSEFVSPFVPPSPDGEPRHFNFEGSFDITGGTGFYEGIEGSGQIGGTLHRHRWGPIGGLGDEEVQAPWFDFVMIGTAEFDDDDGGSDD